MLLTSEVGRKLLYASRDGDVAVVSHLLANHSFDADDATAALGSALDPTIVRMLLQHGADVKVVPLRMIPLSDAPGELVRLLAEHKYDFKSDGHCILQDFDHDRGTLDWLLDQGVDINRTDIQRLDGGFGLAIGETDSSLHLLNNVAASGDIDLFDHLVSRGADTSLCTALHAASRCKDAEMSRAMVSHLLDKHNMDINRNNNDLRKLTHDPHDSGSPLCSAILHKNLAVVRGLLNRGARVNSTSDFPVSYAVSAGGGFLPALEPLLHAGADATEALTSSAIARNVDASEVCLRFGADPAPALREAIAREEYRANTVAENAAYSASRPDSTYKKSDRQVERERASQAMVAFLKSAME